MVHTTSFFQLLPLLLPQMFLCMQLLSICHLTNPCLPPTFLSLLPLPLFPSTPIHPPSPFLLLHSLPFRPCPLTVPFLPTALPLLLTLFLQLCPFVAQQAMAQAQGPAMAAWTLPSTYASPPQVDVSSLSKVSFLGQQLFGC